MKFTCLLMVLLSLSLFTKEPPQQINLLSEKAKYNGETLNLDGKITLSHPLGTLQASNASLFKDSTLKKNKIFDSILLEKKVKLELTQGGILTGEKAIYDIDSQKIEFLKVKNKIKYLDQLKTTNGTSLLFSIQANKAFTSPTCSQKKDMIPFTFLNNVIVNIDNKIVVYGNEATCTNNKICLYPKNKKSSCKILYCPTSKITNNLKKKNCKPITNVCSSSNNPPTIQTINSSITSNDVTSNNVTSNKVTSNDIINNIIYNKGSCGCVNYNNISDQAGSSQASSSLASSSVATRVNLSNTKDFKSNNAASDSNHNDFIERLDFLNDDLLNNLKIFSSFIEINLLDSSLYLEKPHGKMQNSIQFSADNLYFLKDQNKLTLDQHTILKNEKSCLLCTSIDLYLKENTFRKAITSKDCKITYNNEKHSSINTLAPIVFDFEKNIATTTTLDDNNCFCYEDDDLIVFSKKAAFQFSKKELLQIHDVILENEVIFISKTISDRAYYGIADKLSYNATTHVITLESYPGKKVIFMKNDDSLNLSADKIQILHQKNIEQDQIKALGTVRFKLTLDEQANLFESIKRCKEKYDSKKSSFRS